ncbi:hypothetical protein BD780_000663 [Clostridium tetanomorphum]|uniref:Two component regulator three Y domain-containing protein n=1 Tax=Clostridium tetanomorphum TaxID=1553 RepID=A0A923IZA5_CLOTT|nr:accessory Sec system protein Asp2 [Clostridium tetanomorphum]KAJ51364.1 hypothetical protein CTM_13030 [Clostridium tetanomorphum DSM 665]MBC2396429.1 hypothetical protein [Clostridium tetanomorphum]MBP1863341.1 hypothetical protein [Clostridium tetanomorphum]NRS83438.1 hypothetical protein [Clostridium tetanomorphum]NRZ96638.1 hypothetical protein [Clostridium tetanomorphum]
MPYINEEIFHYSCDIKYVFKKAIKNYKYLMIIFSAFSPIGEPPHYSYITTFNDIDINKLYILDDYGDRGCYYLGKHRSFNFEASVYKLIKCILSKYNINESNVICTGSSKGGYSCLYYGMKYGMGYIISGAPQSKIGSYLIKQCPTAMNTAKFISGDINNNDIIYLDNLIFDIIKKVPIVSQIFIHVGRGDFHYENHVMPLINTFDKYKIKYELDIEDYSSHNDTGIYYPNYLRKILLHIMK